MANGNCPDTLLARAPGHIIAAAALPVCHPEPAAHRAAVSKDLAAAPFAAVIALLRAQSISSSTQPLDAQSFHGRVQRFDQGYFSLPAAARELLFSGDGVVGTIEPLHIDQSVDFILAGEASDQAVLMLVRPASEIVDHIDIQCAGTTGHDIEVKAL